MIVMLASRSPAECHLYMSLHPCECGEDEFSWSRHELREGPGGLVSVYIGTCPGCERPRQFEFSVGDNPAPPPAFGLGSAPSDIIDPGEFFDFGERAAAFAVVPPGAGPELVDQAYEAATDAVAAVEEVLKFIPPGADMVPATAFKSPTSLARYAKDPSQFARSRLDALLSSHRRVLARRST